MNRGSLKHHEHQVAQQEGFNEAPIHESGKQRSCAAAQRLEPRFNEAPIHESGKSVARKSSCYRRSSLQ